MTIFGLSQSSGAERLLEVGPAGAAVRLTIYDRVGGAARVQVVVPSDSLLCAVVDCPAGGATVEGTSLEGGARGLLDIEVRSNEVQLRARAESGDGWDVAVGLDDFQDAMEGVVPAA
jgi:hypothetical protein